MGILITPLGIGGWQLKEQLLFEDDLLKLFYEELYDRGYAGALSRPRKLDNMETIKELNPEDVLISFSGSVS